MLRDEGLDRIEGENEVASQVRVLDGQNVETDQMGARRDAFGRAPSFELCRGHVMVAIKQTAFFLEGSA